MRIPLEKKPLSHLSVFDYTDYRRYLADYYSDRKKGSTAFSYRFFAKKAGINSVGLYKDVVEGRQNLGRTLIFKFSAAIGHNKKEAEYFENMVFFNEASTIEERTLFFERMISTQKVNTHIIDSTKYEYYQKWYYSAVRALISLGVFRDEERDYKRIAGILNPRIRPDEAKKALAVLGRLGFIRNDETGAFVLADAVISSGVLNPATDVSALNVVNFQKEVMVLANESLDRFGAKSINLSSLTLGISDASVKAIKEELAAVRDRIAALAEKDTAADRVFQLNMQLFPLSDSCCEEAGDDA